VEGYTRVLKTLPPFEKVVADLTIKARELSGFGSLTETIEGIQKLRKDSLAICRAATLVLFFYYQFFCLHCYIYI
jgi:hypothetical protein